MNTAKKLAVFEQLCAKSEALSLPELLALLPAGFAERSVRRWLSELANEGRIAKTGRKRGTRYRALADSRDATVEASGFDAVRFRYRRQRREAVAGIVADVAVGEALTERIRGAAAAVPAEDRQAFVEDLREDLAALSPPRIAGLGVSGQQLRTWLAAQSEAGTAASRCGGTK